YVVATGSGLRSAAVVITSRLVWKRKKEKRRRASFLQLQIFIELIPKVLRVTQIHQGKFRNRHTVRDELARRQTAAHKTQCGTDRCAIEKPEHRVVKLVATDRSKIDIVSQAADEV